MTPPTKRSTGAATAFLIVLLLLPAGSNARFSLSRTDVENMLVKTKRVTSDSYSTPVVFNLVTTPATPRTFVFSVFPAGALRDTGHVNFVRMSAGSFGQTGTMNLVK